MMNSCAYEEKMKRIEIYQSWLQEKQEMDFAKKQKRVELLRRLCDLQVSCGCKDTFLSSCEPGEWQKMIILWSNCKEMKQAFGAESAEVQEMLKEYAKFLQDIEKGWQSKPGKLNAKNTGLINDAIENLQAKLNKYFPRVYYIGDIPINDCEYDILLEYTKDCLKNAAKNKESYRNDLLIVTFMVQVAQKYYRGKFWGAFFEQLKVKVSPEYKSFLEKTLIFTLQKNGKYIVNKNERLNTIFFHAFICDHYANAWFEMLLNYYLDDLNGDLAHHDSTRYHYFLLGLLDKKENSEDVASSELNIGDNYLLRAAAIMAMASNENLSMLKANQALELIDWALKTKNLPSSTNERIKNLFQIWAQDSYRFNQAYNAQYSEKQPDIAWLKVDLENNTFYLDLAEYAFLGKHDDEEIYWQIKTIKRKEQLMVDRLDIISGFKSVAAKFVINPDELFGRIRAELFRGEERVAEVIFKGERLRMFTSDGSYSAALVLGEMYAYANREISVQSFAINAKTDIAKITKYQLLCTMDEVVIVDNYEIRTLGTAVTEGLGERGKIANLTAYDENNRPLAVYSALPILAITLQANKINASSIIINSSRYNLRECRLLEYEKPDTKGIKIVLVDLRQMPSFKDGRINRVSVDIINSSSLKSYSFVYCQDMCLSYANTDILIGDEWRVKIDYHQPLKCRNKNIRPIEPGIFALGFSEGINELFLTLEKEKLNFNLKFPTIMYSFDQSNWQQRLPKEIFAHELPEMLYLKNIVSEKISLDLSGRFSWEYTAVDGVFVCDLQPLLAALNYFDDYAEIYLVLDDVRYNLSTVYLHNIIKKATLTCNYAQDELYLKCTALEDSAIYADIFTKNANICTKSLLINEEITLKANNLLDEFYVLLYQKNEDTYQLIYEQKMYAFDWDNIGDYYIELSGYSDTLHDTKAIDFSEDYLLYNLQMVDEGIYQASLAKKYGNIYKPWLEKTEVEFYFGSAFAKCHISFYHEEDECYNDFLVDMKTNELLESEDDSLAGEEKYSRYKMMFDGECVYYTSVLPGQSGLKNATALCEYDLTDLGFTNQELTALKELNYQFLHEVESDKLSDSLNAKLLVNTLTAKIQKMQDRLLKK